MILDFNRFLFYNLQGLYFMRVVNSFIFIFVGLQFQRFLKRTRFQRKTLRNEIWRIETLYLTIYGRKVKRFHVSKFNFNNKLTHLYLNCNYEECCTCLKSLFHFPFYEHYLMYVKKMSKSLYIYERMFTDIEKII